MEPTPPEGPSSGRPNISTTTPALRVEVEDLTKESEEVASASPAEGGRSSWQPPGQIAECEPEPESAAAAGPVPVGHHEARPLPAAVRDGASAQLWAAWKHVDADGSGTVSRDEFTGIHAALGIPKSSVEEAWLQAVAFMRGKEKAQLTIMDAISLSASECNYYAFIHAFNAVRGAERREVRQQVRSTFLVMQKQPSGLKKAEMGRFCKRVSKQLMLLPPEFEIEADWAAMCERGVGNKVRKASEEAVQGDGGGTPGAADLLDLGTLMHHNVDDDIDNQDGAMTVSFPEFEKWWKRRMGLWETNQAVIPEFFAYKLDEVANLGQGLITTTELAASSLASDTAGEDGVTPSKRWRDSLRKSQGHRSGADLWRVLRPKMAVIITVLRSWGDMDNNARGHSAVHATTLPWFIRDPESRFSGIWDISSVVFLLYVCITVPIRACFPTDIRGNNAHLDVLSGVWIVDTLTDIYFIIDVFLNFFTALPNQYDGTPIADRRQIAEHYVKGWFLIDFISSLPIEYITMLIEAIAGNGSDGDKAVDLRFLKSMRLLRLSKMLRLARLKRLLNKYDNLAKVQEYGNIVMILLIIFAAAHVMTCFWYLSGTFDELVQGDVRYGWVNTEWEPASDTAVSLMDRYTASLYRVFSVMDLSRTNLERRCAVLYHVLLLMVDGLVAGVMSALMISMQGQEREYNDKMAVAKQWMKEQRIPKSRAEPALEYFRSFYKSNVAMQEGKILSSMTPAMKIEFATYLYSKFVANVPLFQNLSPGIIRAICGIVEPTFAVRQQIIYGEGTTGREMYIVIAGELEITAAGQRLGFISDGGFFGETPILEDSAHAEVRRRTVVAVTSCKLCYIRSDKLQLLLQQYPELAMRLKRCSVNSGKTKGKSFDEAKMHANNAGVGVKEKSSSIFDSKKVDSDSRKRSGLQRTASSGALPIRAGGSFVEGNGSVDVTQLSRKVDAMMAQQEQVAMQQDEMKDQQDKIFMALSRLETTMLQLAPHP